MANAKFDRIPPLDILLAGFIILGIEAAFIIGGLFFALRVAHTNGSFSSRIVSESNYTALQITGRDISRRLQISSVSDNVALYSRKSSDENWGEGKILALKSDLPTPIEAGVTFPDGVTVYHQSVRKYGKLCVLWLNISLTKDFEASSTFFVLPYSSAKWSLFLFPSTSQPHARGGASAGSKNVLTEQARKSGENIVALNIWFTNE